MLLLAVFPCCLVDDCPDDKTEQTASHQNGDEDCGNCSPFFSCEGCAFVSAAAEPAQYVLQPLPIVNIYTGFLLPIFSDIHYDFWQPPKLG
jgi:hypothetical protein